MKILSLIPYYFAWHYTQAILNFFSIWANFIRFATTHFSFVILLKTLFMPYKRLTEKYRGGLNLEQLFETLVISFVMRIVGFIIRTLIILIGLIVLLIVLFSGTVLFLIWLILPFLLIFLFVVGILAVFKVNI